MKTNSLTGCDTTQSGQNIMIFLANINMFLPDYVVSISDDSILQSHCCENLKFHIIRNAETEKAWHHDMPSHDAQLLRQGWPSSTQRTTT